MASRTTFVSSFLASEAHAAQIAEALNDAGWHCTASGCYVHGIHSEMWDGALAGGQIEEAADILRARRVSGPFVVVFNSDWDDNVAFRWDGEQAHVWTIAEPANG